MADWYQIYAFHKADYVPTDENILELFQKYPLRNGQANIVCDWNERAFRVSGESRTVYKICDMLRRCPHEYVFLDKKLIDFFSAPGNKRNIDNALFKIHVQSVWKINKHHDGIDIVAWKFEDALNTKRVIENCFKIEDCWHCLHDLTNEEQQRSVLEGLKHLFGDLFHYTFSGSYSSKLICSSDIYNQVMEEMKTIKQQVQTGNASDPMQSMYSSSRSSSTSSSTKHFDTDQNLVNSKERSEQTMTFMVEDSEMEVHLTKTSTGKVFIKPSSSRDLKEERKSGKKEASVGFHCKSDDQKHQFKSQECHRQWLKLFEYLCGKGFSEASIRLQDFHFLGKDIEYFLSAMLFAYEEQGKSNRAREGPIHLLIIITEGDVQYERATTWVAKALRQEHSKKPRERVEGIRINIVKGKIADKKADILVNTTNINLGFEGAVSKSLLRKAGAGLEHETRSKYPINVIPGFVGETAGYQLDCRRVLHVVLDTWNLYSLGNQKENHKLLDVVVTKCLDITENYKFSSIAFPALGTGVLKYPPKEAALGMIAAVENFSSYHPDTSITDVTIVAFTDSVYKDFLKEYDEFRVKKSRKMSANGRKPSGAQSSNDERKFSQKEDMLPSMPHNLEHSPSKGAVPKRNPAVGNQDMHYSFHKSSKGAGSLQRNSLPPAVQQQKSLQADFHQSPGKRPPIVRSVSDDRSDTRLNNYSDESTRSRAGEARTTSTLDKYLTNLEVVITTNKSEKQFKTWQETIKAKCGLELTLNKQKHQVSYKPATWSQMGQVRRAMGLDDKETESEESDGEDSQGDAWNGEGGEGEVDNDSSDTNYNNNLSNDDEDTDDEKQFLASMKGNKQRVIKIKKVSKDIHETMRYFYQKDMEDMEQRNKIKYKNDTILLEGDHHLKLVTTEVKMRGFINDIKEFSFVEIPFETDGGKQTMNKQSVMKIVDRLKNNPYWNDVLPILYDDKVMLSGPIFERVSSFKEIVQQQSKGTQITSRTGRKLIAATEEATDMEDKNKEPNTKQKSLSVGDKKPSFIKSLKIPKNSQTFKTEEGIDVHVYKEDILKLDVDAIVNAANKSLKHGGGIAKVISKAAGSQFKDESDFYIENYGELEVGQSCVTSAGRLPFKRIIHTVGPCINDYKEWDLATAHRDLRFAVMNSLHMANKQGFTSVGIPSISSGEFAVPKKTCAAAYCIAVIDFSRAFHGNLSLTEVHFVDINDKMVEINQLTFASMMKQDADAERKLSKIKENNQFLSNISNRFKKKGKNQGKRKAVKKLSMMNGNVNILSGDIKTHLSKGCILACGLDANMESQAGSLVKELVKDDTKFASSLQREKNKNKKHECGDVISLPTEYFTCDTVYAVVLPTMTREKDKYRSEIQMCYHQLLQMAIQNKKSVTLKLLGTGEHMTLEQSAEALQMVLCNVFLDKKRSNLKLCIVCNDAKTVERIKAVFSKEPEEKEFSAADQDRTRGEGSYSSTNTNNSGNGDTSSDDESESASCQEEEAEEVKTCAICLDDMEMPERLDKCGHTFCKECIDLCFERKPVCPICSTSYGTLLGNQPEGHMKVTTENYESLPGYEGCGIIRIEYILPNGIQKDNHPNPGHHFEGTKRVAFLPDTKEGKTVLEMLRVAFERKLVFTIGRSVTSGRDNTVTWNDIHHKTHKTGGPEKFGYPDQDYLHRVQEELAAKGITKESIPAVGQDQHGTVV